MNYHTKVSDKRSCNSEGIVQTLTEFLNIHFAVTMNTAIQHFHWTLLCLMIYTQIEFGCKRLVGLELIKDTVETVIF